MLVVVSCKEGVYKVKTGDANSAGTKIVSAEYTYVAHYLSPQHMHYIVSLHVTVSLPSISPWHMHYTVDSL